MKNGRCFVSLVAAVLVIVVAGLGWVAPATATQTIDPCYKLCFMKQSSQSLAEKQDCSRRCRASDRYKCDTKCVKTYANPQKQFDCRKTCVGLPGGW
jgi:hypothetical protein